MVASVGMALVEEGRAGCWEDSVELARATLKLELHGSFVACPFEMGLARHVTPVLFVQVFFNIDFCCLFHGYLGIESGVCAY